MKEIPHIVTVVKLILLVVTVATTGLSLYIIHTTYSRAEAERRFVYVEDSKNVLRLALARDISENRDAEAEAHVRRFHEYFFVLSPNAKYIEESMSNALAISDNSVRQQYNLLKERKYFDGMIANGISSEFICDSVRLTLDESASYHATLFGKTSLVYSDRLVFKSLVTTCSLTSCERSVINPNGFIIRNWKILENNDIGVVNR